MKAIFIFKINMSVKGFFFQLPLEIQEPAATGLLSTLLVS